MGFDNLPLDFVEIYICKYILDIYSNSGIFQQLYHFDPVSETNP